MIAVGALHIRVGAWRVVALAGVCLLSLFSIVRLYASMTEDWRGAVMYLVSHARPEDRVLYYKSVGQFAGESYRDWLLPPDAARPLSTGINSANSDWQREIDHASRVWLVLYRTEPGDAEARAIERELSQHYALGREESFPGVGVLEYGAK